MLKLCLKFGIVFVATQIFMSQLIAPAIVSKSPDLAFFAGLVWMFMVGIIVYRTWMKIVPTPEAHPYKDLMDMPDPQQAWEAENKKEK